MAELDGYTCDNCGKVGRNVKTSFGPTVIPYNWYKVFPGWDNWKTLHYCSKACLSEGCAGTALVSVPEPPDSTRALIKRLLKVWFR